MRISPNHLRSLPFTTTTATRRLLQGNVPAAGRVADRWLLPRANSIGEALKVPGLSCAASMPKDAEATGDAYLQLDHTFRAMSEGTASGNTPLDTVFKRYCGGPGLRYVNGGLEPFRFTYRHNQLWRGGLPLPVSLLSDARGLRPYAIATCAPEIEGFAPNDYMWMLWNQRSTDVLTLVRSPWWPQTSAQFGDITVRRVNTRTMGLPAMAQGELEELAQPWNNDLWLDTLRNPDACTTEDVLVTSDYILQRGDETRRITVHLFTGWPDLGVVHGRTLGGLVRVVQDNAGSGPLAVNCLAGVGRTGTYLCADALTRRAPSELQRNAFSATLWEVFKLRLQRPKMVQREVQFFGVLAALPHLRAGVNRRG